MTERKTSGNNFALIGAAGYIAPRHLKAIRETGNRLICALDPYDGVGILDNYFPETDFFTESERFDRHLDKLRRMGSGSIDYVSICSPNYLHDAHIRMALRNGAHAICEKPVVLNPWNLDALMNIEEETGKDIYAIMQLRLHPSIVALKAKVDNGPSDKVYDVKLDYVTPRGQWYFFSWKGDLQRSGGLATNIGIHFFDMLQWVFGELQELEVIENNMQKVQGNFIFKKARVEWFLSIDRNDLPPEVVLNGQPGYRSLTIDGQAFDFSAGFTDLHTLSYKKILSGEGFSLESARPSVEIASRIRYQKLIHSYPFGMFHSTQNDE
jgi:UDP-N-acetyl-2-amino-2-deoxyglucuronate dehydrogenase